ncbi:Yaf9p [Malassezia vespertilionis]|uniref:Protein AF-9 homolog n=1 Tax=Malassezia vespertilionis TaxID=2020962 RepID=A0A2N1J8P1_9BASI|nr:Yaf9p [Malassezia vespertilionis]
MASKRMRGIAVARPILIGSTATPLSPSERLTAPPDHTHRWTVAVRSAASNPLPSVPAEETDGPRDESAIGTRQRESELDLHKAVGGKDDLSYFIKRVQFRLHETYAQPTRNIDTAPFSVTETGWGEFEIQIKLFFVPEASEKPLTVLHHLKLHAWPTTPISSTVVPGPAAISGPSLSGTPAASLPRVVHSWQYEEIVFPEPLESFYDILVSHPPTPWPVASAQAFADPKSYEAYRADREKNPLHPLHTPTGHLAEALSLEAQRNEADRIDQARVNLVRQLDSDRVRLIEMERSVAEARAKIAALEPAALQVPPASSPR